MLLWSAKAEADYLARHPRVSKMKNPRRAGTEALYEGKPPTGTVLTAYKMRGWIDVVKKTSDFGNDKQALRKWKRNEYMKKKNHEKSVARWKELVTISKEGCTIEQAAERMGVSVQSIKSFIAYRSKDLGEEYGQVNLVSDKAPAKKTKKKTGQEKDIQLWENLHSLCKQGYNIVNAATLMRMAPVQVSNFVRKHRKDFEPMYGEIDFDKNKSRYNYVPSFMKAS